MVQQVRFSHPLTSNLPNSHTLPSHGSAGSDVNGKWVPLFGMSISNHSLKAIKDGHELSIPLRNEHHPRNQDSLSRRRVDAILPRPVSSLSPRTRVSLWRHSSECRNPRISGVELVHEDLAFAGEDYLRFHCRRAFQIGSDAGGHGQDYDADAG